MYPTLPSSLRIGVLRGGKSPFYNTSLQSGGTVLQHLGVTHKPLDIFISKDGTWHVNGLERSPERILKQVDVVWNGLSLENPNTVSLHDLFSGHQVLPVGSGKLPSLLAHNRARAKEIATSVGVKTPAYIVVLADDNLAEKSKEIFYSLPHPLVVKPLIHTASENVYRADSFVTLLSALEQGLPEYGSSIVEEDVGGTPVSCFVTNNFRGQKTYVFPPVSREDKALSEGHKREAERAAKEIHNSLGLSDYSQSVFIISPKRGVHFLKVKTVPEVHKESLLHHALALVGVETIHFIHHLLSLAVNKRA